MTKMAAMAGIFFAILGRGPRAFLIGKISSVNQEIGKISSHSKMTIFYGGMGFNHQRTIKYNN